MCGGYERLSCVHFPFINITISYQRNPFYYTKESSWVFLIPYSKTTGVDLLVDLKSGMINWLTLGKGFGHYADSCRMIHPVLALFQIGLERADFGFSLFEEEKRNYDGHQFFDVANFIYHYPNNYLTKCKDYYFQTYFA